MSAGTSCWVFRLQKLTPHHYHHQHHITTLSFGAKCRHKDVKYIVHCKDTAQRVRYSSYSIILLFLSIRRTRHFIFNWLFRDNMKMILSFIGIYLICIMYIHANRKFTYLHWLSYNTCMSLFSYIHTWESRPNLYMGKSADESNKIELSMYHSHNMHFL